MTVDETRRCNMLSLLKKLLLFRVGQKTSKGFSHRIGLHSIAWMVGLVGGYRYMRRHS
jgi:hypothetical protein